MNIFNTVSSEICLGTMSLVNENSYSSSFIITTFILLILASAANPLFMHYKLSRTNRSDQKIPDNTDSIITVPYDNLEMTPIIIKDNSSNPANSRISAKPPEASKLVYIYASSRIIKSPKINVISQPSLSPHQRARRQCYGVVEEKVSPFLYIDKCYNAIFYESRISQLMNKDPFLSKPTLKEENIYSFKVCSDPKYKASFLELKT